MKCHKILVNCLNPGWLEVWEGAQDPLAELDAKLQPGSKARDDLIRSAFWGQAAFARNSSR